MPDIFGKHSGDYAHLRALEAVQAGAGNRRHDFRALGSGGPSGPASGRQMLRMSPMGRRLNMADDAAVLGYLTNNLEAVQSQIEEVLYSEFRLDKFIPIFTEVPEGAKTYGYTIVDGRGEFGWIDNQGTNAGTGTASIDHVAYTLAYSGGWAQWAKEDLRSSMMAGVPLDDYAIKHESRAAKDFIERVGITGSAEKGYYGLVNQPTGATGDKVRLETLNDTQRFSALNGDEMADLIAAQISAMVVDSSEIIGTTLSEGMSVYVPIAQHNLLTTKRLRDSPNLTAWEWAKKNNQWTQLTSKELELHMVTELKDRAVNGTDDRMIVGINSREIMEMAQPIPPRTMNVIDQGFFLRVPIEAKIGGLQVKRPIGLRYVDNV